MGDGAATAQLDGMARRRGMGHVGLPRFWRGTPEIGLARCVDAGYVFEDRNTLAACRRNGNLTFLEQCAQVRDAQCNGP